MIMTMRKICPFSDLLKFVKKGNKITFSLCFEELLQQNDQKKVNIYAMFDVSALDILQRIGYTYP